MYSKIFKLSILLLVCSGFFQVGVESVFSQDILTNLECVINATRRIVSQSADSLEIFTSKGIFVIAEIKSNDLSQFLYDQFVQDFQNRHHRISMVSKVPENGLILTVIPVQAAVDYTGIKSSGWFKDGVVDRKVNVAFTLQVWDIENTRPVFRHTFHDSVSDQLPYTRLDDVERDILLKKPARPSRRGFRSIAEPVLALITLLGTVYLFYSIRSQ